MKRPNDSHPHVVFSGGQTGGHLFPGLAVAASLQQALPACRITFCGSGCSFDRSHVQQAGFEYFPIAAAPFSISVGGSLRFVSANLKGLRTATDLLDRQQVSLVVGLGGFSSVPLAWAAARRPCPLILLEQNVVPGRATRWLASSANVICLAWPAARAHLSESLPVRVTGNPVRPAFLTDTATTRGRCQRRLAVLGGSRGAGQLNEAMPGVLHRLNRSLAGWEILHQSGASDWSSTRQRYDRHQLPACVVPFIRHPALALTKSDLVVCRSGGTTLAELAVLGLPSVLAPYPHAAADHQRLNARYFAEAGAAAIVASDRGSECLQRELAREIQPLLAEDGRRHKMAVAAHKRARADAAERVTSAILELLDTQQLRRAA